MTPPSALEKLVLQNDLEELLSRFDDAVLRNDRQAFQSLWAADGVWEISEPLPMRAQGIDSILEALDRFHSANQFFFRSTSRPVINLSGHTAELRSPTVELARRDGGVGYSNVAVYFDRAVFNGERWKFARRFYQYLWVDTASKLAGVAVPLSSPKQEGLGS